MKIKNEVNPKSHFYLRESGVSSKKVGQVVKAILISALMLACNNSKSTPTESAELSNARNNAVWYGELSDRYKMVSNAVCVVPFFTVSYDDAVANAGQGSADEVVTALTTISAESLTTDVAAAALAEFGGKSPLTHSQVATKSINFVNARFDAAKVLKIVQELPPRAASLLNNAAATQGTQGLTKVEAFKVMLARRATTIGATQMLGALSTNVIIPRAFGAIVTHGASLLSQSVNILGFYGIFCLLNNTLAAAFDAMAAENQAIQTGEQLHQMGIDSCFRMNSHKRFYNRACAGAGALKDFDDNGVTRCKGFWVDNKAGAGTRVFWNESMASGRFRVGPGMFTEYISSKTLSNGFIVANVKIHDSRTTYNGQTGWIFVGGVFCQK